jgi:predicted MPP superfamily phosphohydrolase
MYDAIVQNVIARQEKPHLVFFTGDLAFSGAREEYDLLEKRFLGPLRQALGADCPILTVPGNHDVERKRVINPRIWMIDPELQRIFQQVDGDGQQKRADMILPRFRNYRMAEQSLGAWDEDWLAAESGTASLLHEIEGRRLAIIWNEYGVALP